jgi:hypothetical protein
MTTTSRTPKQNPAQISISFIAKGNVIGPVLVAHPVDQPNPVEEVLSSTDLKVLEALTKRKHE